jgi:hypothetical protein
MICISLLTIKITIIKNNNNKIRKIIKSQFNTEAYVINFLIKRNIKQLEFFKDEKN